MRYLGYQTKCLLICVLINKGRYMSHMSNLGVYCLCILTKWYMLILNHWTLYSAVQQIQPAYIHQNHQGCLNIPIFGVDVSGTFLITILFKGSAPVCTLARIFNGASPVVEIDANYKGRVACGLDEANNRVNLCFTSGVVLNDGGIYFGSTSTSSNNILYVMGK